MIGDLLVELGVGDGFGLDELHESLAAKKRSSETAVSPNESDTHFWSSWSSSVGYHPSNVPIVAFFTSHLTQAAPVPVRLLLGHGRLDREGALLVHREVKV